MHAAKCAEMWYCTTMWPENAGNSVESSTIRKCWSSQTNMKKEKQSLEQEGEEGRWRRNES
jgi:hypothetical protein